MAQTAYGSVDDYLAAQPEPARRCLDIVRATIREALPDAEEVISYQIPAYRVGGRVAIYFAGWKAHYSIYPLSDALLAALGDELSGFEMAKGTIRFPFDRAVPVELIRRIAAFNGREAAAHAPKRKAKG